jgi:uncharacterized damage-inducible protein DinB
MSEIFSETPCLFADNRILLLQGLEVLRGISPEVFTTVDARCLGGSIGGHVRHCIELYRCFLQGLKTGRLDYDARARDLLLETDPVAACEALLATTLLLDEAAANSANGHPLLVVENHDGTELEWSSSSVGRELRFLLSHTVHHYALIAILLRVRGMATPQGFGIAPSTLRHRARETSAACVR